MRRIPTVATSIFTAELWNQSSYMSRVDQFRDTNLSNVSPYHDLNSGYIQIHSLTLNLSFSCINGTEIYIGMNYTASRSVRTRMRMAALGYSFPINRDASVIASCKMQAMESSKWILGRDWTTSHAPPEFTASPEVRALSPESPQASRLGRNW